MSFDDKALAHLDGDAAARLGEPVLASILAQPSGALWKQSLGTLLGGPMGGPGGAIAGAVTGAVTGAVQGLGGAAVDKVTEAGREAMQRRKRIKIPPLDYVFVTPTRFGIYAFRRGWNLPKLQREVLLVPRSDVEGILVSRNHPVFFHVTLHLAQNREIKLEYSRNLDDRFIKVQAQLGGK